MCVVPRMKHDIDPWSRGSSREERVDISYNAFLWSSRFVRDGIECWFDAFFFYLRWYLRWHSLLEARGNIQGSKNIRGWKSRCFVFEDLKCEFLIFNFSRILSACRLRQTRKMGRFNSILNQWKSEDVVTRSIRVLYIYIYVGKIYWIDKGEVDLNKLLWRIAFLPTLPSFSPSVYLRKRRLARTDRPWPDLAPPFINCSV